MINSNMISYPRKCPYCNYLANNPAMFSYHKQTHDAIPLGTYCHFGCGCLAITKNTGGKYTCKEKYQECSAYLDQLSRRTENSWKNANKRKEKTKEQFLKHCCGVPEIIKKTKDTLKVKWGNFTPSQAKDYRHYARRIRSRAQIWAKKNGYIIGQQTFHVDHKLSIWDTYKIGLSEEIVNHPANLQILDAKKNSSKGSSSSITLEDLLKNSATVILNGCSS